MYVIMLEGKKMTILKIPDITRDSMNVTHADKPIPTDWVRSYELQLPIMSPGPGRSARLCRSSHPDVSSCFHPELIEGCF